MSAPACVNLLEVFGDKYRIEYDPAYDPKRVRHENRDPWMMTIPCRAGTIFPHGGQTLVVEVTSKTAAKLRPLGLTVHQEGDREQTLLFGLSQFEAVAAVVKPRRRRKWSPEQLVKKAAILKVARQTLSRCR
jgi:hypothetical protein